MAYCIYFAISRQQARQARDDKRYAFSRAIHFDGACRTAFNAHGISLIMSAVDKIYLCADRHYTGTLTMPCMRVCQASDDTGVSFSYFPVDAINDDGFCFVTTSRF